MKYPPWTREALGIRFIIILAVIAFSVLTPHVGGSLCNQTTGRCASRIGMTRKLDKEECV